MTQVTTRIASATLTRRADQLQALLRDHATDQHGIVRANVHLRPVRPLKAGDIVETQHLVKTCSPEDLVAYEDAGMATGAALAASSIRYRMTGESEARVDAEAAFQGLKYIYHLGVARGDGYFCKPYGARCSDQISRDQYLFALAGLAEFNTIANECQRQVIRRMASSMSRYWQRIAYQTSYFGMPPASHLSDYMGSLFLGIAGIGKALAPSVQGQAEYDRLFHEEALGPRMPETLIEQFRQGRTYDGAMYLRQAENPMMMKAMAIDFLWEDHPQQRDLWTRSLQAFWDDDLPASLDSETGLAHFIMKFNPDSGQCTTTAPGVIDELENPLGLAILNYGGLRKSAGSTQIAYAAAVVASRLQHPQASAIVKTVLNKLTLDKFRGLTVPSAEHIPPGHQHEQSLLNTAYVAYWLWTYWLSRERQLLD